MNLKNGKVFTSKFVGTRTITNRYKFLSWHCITTSRAHCPRSHVSAKLFFTCQVVKLCARVCVLFSRRSSWNQYVYTLLV